jgi:hypothetical protein
MQARMEGAPPCGTEPPRAARAEPPHPILGGPSRPAACLKDLQRFLRRDHPEDRDAFFKLGELQVGSFLARAPDTPL